MTGGKYSPETELEVVSDRQTPDRISIARDFSAKTPKMKLIVIGLSLVGISGVISESDLHILESEIPKDNVEKRSSSYYSSNRIGTISNCATFQSCLPLSQCAESHYDLAKSCLLSGDRSSVCGYSSDGADPLICCNRRTSFDSVEGLPQFGSSPAYPNNLNGINPPSCGRNIIQSQVYRGLGAFPFVARVGFKNTNSGSMAYPCSGSIISKRVILTAAHCALAKADGHRLSSVRIGEYDTTKDPDCEAGFCAPSPINHAISHVIVHPDYITGQYHHDVALLILRTPLNFTVATQPICLQPEKDSLIVGKRALIFGWGKMSTTTIRLPEIQYLDVPLVPWDLCLRVYGSTGALDSAQSVEGQWLCAGGEAKDACQGFGGAPLVVRENGVYYQIGIMSFGSDNCGGARIPSVYSSVSFFYQWIKENIPVE